MDSLVTLITTASTSTSRCGNNFHATSWQFYADILQGVDIQAGQKLCKKGDFMKNRQRGFFVAIWRQKPIYNWRRRLQNQLHPLRHVIHLHYWLPFAMKIRSNCGFLCLKTFLNLFIDFSNGDTIFTQEKMIFVIRSKRRWYSEIHHSVFKEKTWRNIKHNAVAISGLTAFSITWGANNSTYRWARDQTRICYTDVAVINKHILLT